MVGVDLGVRDLLVAATPDGTQVARMPAPKPLAQAQARLRALQRKAARQVGPDRRTGRRPSKRWSKTAARIGRIHARAANIRRDVLHKATTQLAQRHQVIVVEDLAVANMIPPQARRRPGRPRAQPGDGRRRPGGAAAPARLQDHLVWLGSTRRGPVVSQLEDLFGVRLAKAKPAPWPNGPGRVTAAAPTTTVTSTPRSTSPA